MYIGFIYLTTNKINNKKYIGKHTKFNDNYLGSGTLLKRAIKKYGKNNFKREILSFAFTHEQLDKLEIYFIDYYNAVENDEYYNIHVGGSGGNTIKGHSKEWLNDFKYRMSLITKGKKNGMQGKHHSEESKAKMKKNWNRNDRLQTCKSENFKNKMSKVTSGELNGMYGKSHSKESKVKMSKNSKGKTLKEKNGMYGKSKDKALNGKKVYQYKDKDMDILIREFNTIQCALEYLRLKGHISLNKAIKNKTMYKGYYWSKKIKGCRDYLR